jgi:hypothetical protein
MGAIIAAGASVGDEGRSAATASAEARSADAAVATATSAAAAYAIAVVVPPYMEYADAVVMDTIAPTASGLVNLEVGVSAAVGMMSENEKAKTPAGRVDDTCSNTSAIRAKGILILLQGLAAATAAVLAAS